MLQTAIVILNYNNYEDTINCIESVEKYNTAPIKYIVVDNGSTRDGTIERLDKFLSERFMENYLCFEEDGSIIASTPLPRMTFLVSKTNDGYARGNNKGLRLANTDAEIEQILVLNNDILFIENIIPDLLDKLYTLPQVGIVSPMLLKKDGKEIEYPCARTNVSNWELILTFLCMYRDPFGLCTKATNSHFILKCNPQYCKQPYIEIELPSGSCMLFKKDLMSRIRLFDENTFLYYEENILFKQEEKLGLKNYLIPNLKCIHLGASTTNKSARSFIVKALFKSASYYMRTYGNLSFAQRLVLPVALLSMKIKCGIIKLTKKKHG